MRKLAVEPTPLPQMTPIPRAELKPLARSGGTVLPPEEMVIPPSRAERLLEPRTSVTAPPQSMPSPSATESQVSNVSSPQESVEMHPTQTPLPPAASSPRRDSATDALADSAWQSDFPDAGSAASGWRSVPSHTEPPTPSPTPAPGPLAEKYQARVAEDREEIVRRRGGSAETEAAVRLALRWLVAHQSENGCWDASQHGAGQGHLVDGHFRGPAGLEADTGITGLAVLALLGAGNTHAQGEYRTAVGKGLEYLLRSQAADGNLYGQATNYARMYCHGIATLAISEALAMSQDERLKPFVQRAINFSVASQHPVTGGWRYQPGDQGDTSQLGWQIMAFTTAADAGIEVPSTVAAGAERFLRSVSYGAHRGLASYRPGMAATPSMTAEALACRVFLGTLTSDWKTKRPATSGKGCQGPVGPISTIWYYATLGLSQTDSIYWEEWNAALTQELLRTQEHHGENDGSWSPDTVWGGHGGRVYSTSMAALCLEVYYRYPLRRPVAED